MAEAGRLKHVVMENVIAAIGSAVTAIGNLRWPRGIRSNGAIARCCARQLAVRLSPLHTLIVAVDAKNRISNAEIHI